MINTEDFIKRLELILEYYNITASTFADKIGVQRSSLSHLLSGRNKPSLDLILKITNVFPEVDLYWILNGVGNFPKTELKQNTYSSTSIFESKTEIQPDLFSSEIALEKNTVNKTIQEEFSNMQILAPNNESQEIDRIVIFFKNGSFKSYSN